MLVLKRFIFLEFEATVRLPPLFKALEDDAVTFARVSFALQLYKSRTAAIDFALFSIVISLVSLQQSGRIFEGRGSSTAKNDSVFYKLNWQTKLREVGNSLVQDVIMVFLARGNVW